METNAAYAPPPPIPTRQSNVGRVLGIIGLVFLLLIGGCVAMVAVGYNVSKTAHAPAEQFLTYLEKNDIKAAYGMFSKSMQKPETRDALQDALEVFVKRRGKPIGHTGPNSFHTSNYNGVVRVNLGYREKYEKGEVPVAIVLVKEGGEWKVESFNTQL